MSFLRVYIRLLPITAVLACLILCMPRLVIWAGAVTLASLLLVLSGLYAWVWWMGRDERGVAKWRCPECGAAFTQGDDLPLAYPSDKGIATVDYAGAPFVPHVILHCLSCRTTNCYDIMGRREFERSIPVDYDELRQLEEIYGPFVQQYLSDVNRHKDR